MSWSWWFPQDENAAFKTYGSAAAMVVGMIAGMFLYLIGSAASSIATLGHTNVDDMENAADASFWYFTSGLAKVADVRYKARTFYGLLAYNHKEFESFNQTEYATMIVVYVYIAQRSPTYYNALMDSDILTDGQRDTLRRSMSYLDTQGRYRVSWLGRIALWMSGQA